MALYLQISPQQLSRRIGLAEQPVVIDVRVADDVAADPRRIPASRPYDYRAIAEWAPALAADAGGRPIVVSCQKGLKLSQGVAAWLRHHGLAAESLEGGFEAWRAEGLILLNPALLPAAGADGRTVWVTRQRPKVDRIACPWLIRRFVDPRAVFLFVAPGDVTAVAERFGATPFDVEGVFWSHRGDTCTFDTMLAEFGLRSDALDRLATIVRAADTARLDLAPEAAGFLAISLGLSRVHSDDLAQLEAGFPLYDALYRWSRDAIAETHNWPAPDRRS
jgi:rhodanese-related sulfurtransferase